jgi:hypothetical protein
MTDEQRALMLLRFLSDGSVRTVDEACLSVDQSCSPRGWMLLANRLHQNGYIYFHWPSRSLRITRAGLDASMMRS